MPVWLIAGDEFILMIEIGRSRTLHGFEDFAKFEKIGGNDFGEAILDKQILGRRRWIYRRKFGFWSGVFVNRWVTTYVSAFVFRGNFVKARPCFDIYIYFLNSVKTCFK